MKQHQKPISVNNRSFLKSVVADAQTIGKDLAYLIFLGAIFAIVFGVAKEVLGGSFLIEPISVPDSFAASGITKDAVSAKIRDEIATLVAQSPMGGEANVIKSIAEGNSTPEINVLGTGIPVKYVIYSLRGILPFPYRTFTGELTLARSHANGITPRPECTLLTQSRSQATRSIRRPNSGQVVRLVLREAGSAGAPLVEAQGFYDDVTRCAALEALKVIDPFSAASFLSQRLKLPEEALALIDRSLSPPDESSGDSARKQPTESEIARAQLARAYVLMDKGDYCAAYWKFRDADSAYIKSGHRQPNKPTELGKVWYAASDGLAQLMFKGKNYQGAFDYAEASLQANPKFSSALYHEAQSFDEHARRIFNNVSWVNRFVYGGPKTEDLCAPIRFVDSAENKYEKLIHDYPDFGVAYSQEAIMLSKKLSYMINRPREASTCGADQSTLPALAQKIKDRFVQGTTRDPRFADAWYEWGLFKFRQRWSERPSSANQPSGNEGANAEREELDEIADDYERAIRLIESVPNASAENKYLWLRKAQALNKRSELLKRSELPSPTAHAAFCKYIKLVNSDKNIPRRASTNDGCWKYLEPTDSDAKDERKGDAVEEQTVLGDLIKEFSCDPKSP
jgi:tetratricopeptide (TPR) repeat protein